MYPLNALYMKRRLQHHAASTLYNYGNEPYFKRYISLEKETLCSLANFACNSAKNCLDIPGNIIFVMQAEMTVQ